MDDYLSECIMGGDALNECPLDDVPFAVDENYDELLATRILNAINSCNPLIKIHNLDSEASEITLDIYYINNFEDIEDFYCVKVVKDFMMEGLSLYQIIDIKIKSLDMINDFWLTSKADIAQW